MSGRDFVEKAVKDTFGNESTFTQGKDASGGFLSSVQFLTVTRGNGEKLKVVLKLPDISKITEHYERTKTENRPIGMEFINAAHDNEARFLGILGSYKRETGELLWLPEVYAAQDTKSPQGAYIFMGDFSDRATLPEDINPQAPSVVKGTINALADLAVVSISKPEVTKDVKPLKEMYDIVLPDFKNGLGYLHREYPDVFPVDVGKVIDAFNFTKYLNDFVYGNANCACSVLVHRDVFPRNILVEKQDPSKFVTLLDWQTGGVGPPGEDMSRLLTTSLDPEDRRANTEHYLQYYFDAIKEKCNKKSLELPFSYADVKAGYGGSLGFNTMMICNVSSYCLQAMGDAPQADREKIVKRCYGCVKDAFNL